MERDRLKHIADENITYCQSGRYPLPMGQSVSIAQTLELARSKTVLYRPVDFPLPFEKVDGETTIEVTDESTGAAAQRVASLGEVCLLNFASAVKPGGGFLNGARAQEEDLARASALYFCLREQRPYYEENQACGSAFYTDHVIYSPQVPFFRDERMRLLPQPFLASVLTAPAPNASVMRAQREELKACILQRAHKVLQVAAHHGERSLVLGAWGCGVFGNDPGDVAEAFGEALARMTGAFRRVTFAVYDRSDALANLQAFKARFN